MLKLNISIKQQTIVILMANEKIRSVGIVLLVIGSIILVFANIYANMVASSLTGWEEAIRRAGTIQGVVIIVIGLVLLLVYYRVFRSDEPGKKSRWKQAEPIT